MCNIKWIDEHSGKKHIEAFSTQDAAQERIDFLKSNGVDAWLA